MLEAERRVKQHAKKMSHSAPDDKMSQSAPDGKMAHSAPDDPVLSNGTQPAHRAARKRDAKKLAIDWEVQQVLRSGR